MMGAKKRNHWADDGKGYRGECTIGSRPKSCVAMRLALNKERGKGLGTGLLMDLSTGKTRGIVLYRQSAADGGCLVKFCPFCGARIEPENAPTPRKRSATK